MLLWSVDDDGLIPDDEERDDNGEPIWPVLCCGGACDYGEASADVGQPAPAGHSAGARDRRD